MTVTQKYMRKVISGSGWANPLTHNVYLESAADLKVWADDELLVLGDDYTVTDLQTEAGYEVTITALTPGDEDTEPTSFVLSVEPDIDQPSDTSLGGQFGTRYEVALDLLTRRLQRVFDMAERGLKLPNTTVLGDEVIYYPGDAGNLPMYTAEGGLEDTGENATQIIGSTAAAIAAAVLAVAARDEAVAAQPRGRSLFEHFGAVGDGVTDDTVAVALAFASGLPLSCVAGRTYKVGTVAALEDVDLDMPLTSLLLYNRLTFLGTNFGNARHKLATANTGFKSIRFNGPCTVSGVLEFDFDDKLADVGVHFYDDAVSPDQTVRGNTIRFLNGNDYSGGTELARVCLLAEDVGSADYGHAAVFDFDRVEMRNCAAMISMLGWSTTGELSDRSDTSFRIGYWDVVARDNGANGYYGYITDSVNSVYIGSANVVGAVAGTLLKNNSQRCGRTYIGNGFYRHVRRPITIGRRSTHVTIVNNDVHVDGNNSAITLDARDDSGGAFPEYPDINFVVEGNTLKSDSYYSMYVQGKKGIIRNNRFLGADTAHVRINSGYVAGTPDTPEESGIFVDGNSYIPSPARFLEVGHGRVRAGEDNLPIGTVAELGTGLGVRYFVVTVGRAQIVHNETVTATRDATADFRITPNGYANIELKGVGSGRIRMAEALNGAYDGWEVAITNFDRQTWTFRVNNNNGTINGTTGDVFTSAHKLRIRCVGFDTAGMPKYRLIEEAETAFQFAHTEVATDADATLTAGATPHKRVYTGTLTAARTLTLADPTTVVDALALANDPPSLGYPQIVGAQIGKTEWHISRSGGGLFQLIISTAAPVVLCALAQGEWAIIRYGASGYYVAARGGAGRPWHVPATDAAATFTYVPHSHGNVVYLDVPITVNRTVTMSTANPIVGDRCRFIRGPNATGAFNWLIGAAGAVKTLSAVNTGVDAEWDGSAWRAVGNVAL